MNGIDRAEERHMFFSREPGTSKIRFLRSAAIAVTLLSCLAACREDEVPRTFKTPDDAVAALNEALGSDDPASVEVLFGPGSLEHLRSGDPVADREDIANVRKLIGEGVKFEDGAENTKWVILGKEEWPFAFPVVSKDGRWKFDLEQGIEELKNRRVGRNELYTLASLHAYVDAQREYYALKPEGDPPRFAQKFKSDEGTRNGLYWPTAEGEEPSPLGDLVAQAASEGYGPQPASGGDGAAQAATEPSAAGNGVSADGSATADGAAVPEAGAAKGDDATAASGEDVAADDGPRTFHGYRFRILTGQSKNAAPGEMSYLDKAGLMTRGFAAVAWPASYGNSGVMTFQVNARGIVFEKDLGADTPNAVKAITVYDPDQSWNPTGD